MRLEKLINLQTCECRIFYYCKVGSNKAFEIFNLKNCSCPLRNCFYQKIKNSYLYFDASKFKKRVIYTYLCGEPCTLIMKLLAKKNKNSLGVII